MIKIDSVTETDELMFGTNRASRKRTFIHIHIHTPNGID